MHISPSLFKHANDALNRIVFFFLAPLRVLFLGGSGGDGRKRKREREKEKGKIGNESRRSNNADARTHGNDDGQTWSGSLHRTETFR